MIEFVRYTPCPKCHTKPRFTFPGLDPALRSPCRCEKQAYEKWCWENGKLDWQAEESFRQYNEIHKVR